MFIRFTAEGYVDGDFWFDPCEVGGLWERPVMGTPSVAFPREAVWSNFDFKVVAWRRFHKVGGRFEKLRSDH